jgi:protein farnesyltransferase subunit beta
MTEGGEADTRGVYTALASARLAGLLTPQLAQGVGDYLSRCQTYEGGLGAEPGAEAHGGYTFCGLAAALLAGEAHRLNLPRLLHWAVQRQGALEGGFCGRTHKLVDGCYSLWQGGLFPLLRSQMPLLLSQLRPGRAPACPPSPGPALYSSARLQGWVLSCCQAPEGGLRDKPGKPRDLYHTCYCLSGLSSAQHYGDALAGPPDDLLEPADALLNVATSRLADWDLLLCSLPALADEVAG